MTTSSAALPGFSAPAASFDEPFAMLSGCHERVERTLRLLARLVEHVAAKGSDAQAQSAANDVLRYFDIAAPLHHEDEERHVFPPLIAQGDASVVAHVRRMQADHQQMSGAWATLRPLLEGVAMGQAVDPSLAGRATAFSALYDSHIATEESFLYPKAESAITPVALRLMSEDMRLRRTAAGSVNTVK